MDFEDLDTSLYIRVVDRYLAVESSGSQQRRIKDVGSVGSRHAYDAVIDTETVHFNKQLVKSLLSFIMAAAPSGSSVTADRIDLVYKHYTGCGLFCGFKKVSHAGSTHTDIHFHKIRTGYRIERDSGLARNGFGKKRFTGSRRADEQNALRYTCAERRIFVRIFEELDNFLKLFLFFVCAGDIGKEDLFLFVGAQLCACLAERVHTAAEAAEAARAVTRRAVFCRSTRNKQPPNHYHYDDNDDIRKERHPHGKLRGRLVIVIVYDALSLLLLYRIVEILVKKA